jgi:hypothetical protein
MRWSAVLDILHQEKGVCPELNRTSRVSACPRKLIRRELWIRQQPTRRLSKSNLETRDLCCIRLATEWPAMSEPQWGESNGPKRVRTADLYTASVALYQLSYRPVKLLRI